MKRPWIAALTLALAGSNAGPARAESDASEVEWRWREFQTWEYVATTVTLGGAIALRFGTQQPEADWTGGILFDDWVRERARLDDPDNRRLVDKTADAILYGGFAYRILDSALVASLVWGDGETSIQMSLIDLEAFGLVAITLWGSQELFGRQRPWVERCADPDVRAERDCAAEATDRNRSFYAGHPAIAVAVAGLTCAHHSNLPLYGGGAADTLACGVTTGAAIFSGFARIQTDKHYPTDVAVGFGIGAFAGFVMPHLLHYDHPVRPQSAKQARALNVRASVVPVVSEDNPGVALIGVF